MRMADAIAVLNAGSSSIKFSLFVLSDDRLDCERRGQIEEIHTAPRFVAKDAQGRIDSERTWPQGTGLGHDGALEHLLGYLRGEVAQHRLIGVGHRVVHGGPGFAAPVLVDAAVLDELQRYVPFMPLHQPHNLAAIRLLLDRAPALPQVACFDTAFHRTVPELAQMFALPVELHAAGIRRYGFHGLSYEYVASVLPRHDPAAAAGRAIVLHLGNGASLCALQDGRSVATSMGLTALDGLPMGTRCGSLDPGVLLYLLDQRGMDASAIERLLYAESGLLGVSGVSSDMRALLASDSPRARLAIDLFVYRIRREIGSLAAALGGLDALVFTGGIGENAPSIRQAVCRDAAWLGLELDPEANASGCPRVSLRGSRVRAWVVPTNEELMIAQHTRRLVTGRGTCRPGP
jgi:acetate kinase